MIYRRLFDLPTWRLRNPFEELERMRSQMDRVMEGFSGSGLRPSAGVFPAVNLTEDADRYYVRAELPGIKSEDLDIQVTGRNLSLSGERVIAPDVEGARYHRREREGGKFSRVIGLPGEVNPEKVEARLANGVLTVSVAKAEAAKPRKITIN
ncbi:MAG: Hsp20/alpha crystallin family protein [Desulfobacterales bacterium]|jgi:HSP20 family protein